MKSMTGYGYARKKDRKGGIFEVEIISLNLKGKEISISGNRKFLGIEPCIRKLIDKYLERGKLTIRYNISLPQDVEVNQKLLDAYSIILNKLFKNINTSKINLENFIQLPDLISYREDTKSIRDFFLKTFEKALQNLMNSKKREGENLKRRIEKEIKNLEKVLQKIEEHECNEEKIRILSHINEMKKILRKKKGPWGRSLDFWGQEILREANTISQKALHLLTVQRAVRVKEFSENIREISRNLE